MKVIAILQHADTFVDGNTGNVAASWGFESVLFFILTSPVDEKCDSSIHECVKHLNTLKPVRKHLKNRAQNFSERRIRKTRTRETPRAFETVSSSVQQLKQQPLRDRDYICKQFLHICVSNPVQPAQNSGLVVAGGSYGRHAWPLRHFVHFVFTTSPHCFIVRSILFNSQSKKGRPSTQIIVPFSFCRAMASTITVPYVRDGNL
ncbi:hypothetical protein AVEN_34650-1 [Araneus ventricosus]|uniref:Uncharacterized protein n=1 Tax=Araneus ventricosus TaxID=182803 RepID=A0A4Y2B1Z9_ARAVE|nr:hypothetical protein AVEN_34650-1 [Araneus ventricosus]